MKTTKETIKTLFLTILAFVGVGLIGLLIICMTLGRPSSWMTQVIQELKDLEKIEESAGDRIYFEKNPDNVYVLSYENGEIFKDSGTLRFRAKNVRKDGENIIFEFGDGGNIVWDTSTKIAMMYENGRTKTYKNVEIWEYEE